MIIAFDPGKNLGVAYVREDGQLEHSIIISISQLADFPLPRGVTIVVGNGTGSDQVRDVLRRRGLPFALVDEKGSSLEGRELYWRDHPPRGWRWLLPKGMRSPPRPIDDYAAYVIALRYLQALHEGN